jgi:transferase CAF17, mitochondrial
MIVSRQRNIFERTLQSFFLLILASMLKRLLRFEPIIRFHHFTAIPLDNRALIRVHGDDTSKFLQGLITNDIEFLKSTNAIYSMLLNARGRILYDMIIYKPHLNQSTYLIEISHNASTDFQRLLRTYKLRKQVNIDDVTSSYRTWSIFSCENQLLSANLDIRESLQLKSRQGLIIGQTDPRHASLGVRLITERSTLLTDLTDICELSNDLSIYKQRLYRHGIAEGIEDMPPGQCIPLEYNIVYLNGVSFQKGCYIGQELVARTHHTGAVRKRLMPVHIDNYRELSKDSNEKVNDLTIINEETKRRAGKLLTSINEYGIALVRLNEWKSQLRIENADVRLRPSIPIWWPTLDEATQLEMKLISTTA